MHKTLGSVLVAAAVILASGGAVRADDKPKLKTFVNSKEGLKGDFLEHYVDFSFDYPATWQIIEESRTEGKNFVKVERKVGTGKDSITQENFAVGEFHVSANAEANKKLVQQMLTQLDTQFKAGFPNYQKTSEGPAKFGAYEGTELRFTSELQNPDPKIGTIKIWGRFVMIPDPKGGLNGVAAILLATSRAPELKEEKDVGVKGELPTIIQSFKLGK